MVDERPAASIWAASQRTVKIEATIFFLTGACITLFMAVEHIFLLAPTSTIGKPSDNVVRTLSIVGLAVGAILGAAAVGFGGAGVRVGRGRSEKICTSTRCTAAMQRLHVRARWRRGKLDVLTQKYLPT